MRWQAVLLVLLMFGITLSGCLGDQQATEVAADPVVEVDERFRPGPNSRFGQLVSLPENVLGGPVLADGEEERPGDMKDDGGVVAHRRYDNSSFWEMPFSAPAPQIENVHGSPGQYYCICDLELVYRNATGQYGWVTGNAEGQRLRVQDSSYILIDNVTIIGGDIRVDDSEHVWVTNSIIYHSFGLDIMDSRHVHVKHNMFIGDTSPSYMYDKTPHFGPCGTGYNNRECRVRWMFLQGPGPTWFEYNYMDYSLGLNADASEGRTVVRHNTFLSSSRIYAYGAEGVEVSWNLVRGYEWTALAMSTLGGAEARMHNNSVGVAFEVDEGSGVISMGYFLEAHATPQAVSENNDMVGWIPLRHHRFHTANKLVWVDNSSVVSRNDYWNGPVDPRFAEDEYVEAVRGGTIEIQSHALEPNHPLDNQPWLQALDLAEHWVETLPYTWGPNMPVQPPV